MAGTNALTWGTVATKTWQHMKDNYTWGDIGGVSYGMDSGMVTVGAASVTGAIYLAPEGTPFPKSATETLNGAFTLLGFTSEDGLTITDGATTQTIKAWEGHTEVVNQMTEHYEDISFKPIQSNQDVLNATWGPDMVTVEDGELVARHHGGELAPVCIVIDTTPREGIIRRFCGTFRLFERGEATLDGYQVDGRKLTFRAVPDMFGVTMRDYMAWLVVVDEGAAKSSGNDEGMGARYLDAHIID